jgi:putative peptidoglycan lipid II flippase
MMIDWAIRLVSVIAIPATLALMILAEPILISLFYYGELLTPRDMNMATLSLRAYSAGIVAFMLIKVLAPGYFARQDVKTPVRIGIIAIIANIGLSIVLILPLHFYLGIGHVGLALATTLAAILNSYLLFQGLRKNDIYRPQPGWQKFLLMLFNANISMCIFLYGCTAYLGSWFDMIWWERLSLLGLICVLGTAVYVSILYLSGFRTAYIKNQ